MCVISQQASALFGLAEESFNNLERSIPGHLDGWLRRAYHAARQALQSDPAGHKACDTNRITSELADRIADRTTQPVAR